MTEQSTRALSAKIFGNAKYAEVVLALGREPNDKTAQDIAKALSVSYSLVRDVLLRLTEAQVLARSQRPHQRAPQFYVVARPDIWEQLLTLADLVERG